MEINDAQILKDILAGKYRDGYLVYNRKSLDEPNSQKNSIKYQTSENLRFAQREHLRIASVSLPGFCSSGLISEKHSGFKEDDHLSFSKEGLVQYQIERPKFQKLVQLLNRDAFKGVICLCWDRITRNKSDDTLIRKLIRRGVDVRFVYARYDKSSAGALHMDIDSMFAEHHSRVTSEKVQLATKNLRERGVVTHKAPLGYLNLGNMDHKPFDPERAPIIKRLFELCANENWSVSDLLRYANNQGLTTMPRRRRRTEEEILADESDDSFEKIPKTLRPIQRSHVHSILTDPFYIGLTYGPNGDYVRSISHEALISEKLFAQVQESLKRRQTSIHYSTKLEFAFRGLIRCDSCGRIYTPYMQKGHLYLSSRCRPGCLNSKKNFPATFLVEELWKLIGRLVLSPDELVRVNSETATEISLMEESRLKALEQNERRKRKVREDISYLRSNKLELLRNAVYTPESMREEETRLNFELTSLQDEEVISDESMKRVVEDVTTLSELLKNIAEIHKTANFNEKEKIARMIFSELTMSENALKYKCKAGFRPLESRLILNCARKAWLSEAVVSNKSTRESISVLRDFLIPTPERGP